MLLKSKGRGEFPPGVHWTAGEVREVKLAESVEIPAFLEPVKKKAKKAKKVDA